MSKPRIMYYNDGRHSHIYRYEPPMQKEEYLSMVDEVVGTSVEAIMLCLGEGRTMLHDTKAGELLGHNVDKWNHAIFRRTYQNAKHLINEGNDPLRIISERAHEKGILLYPNLIMQRGGVDHATVRCSDFRFNNTHLEIGAKGDLDPSFPGYDGLDFKHEEARNERFSIIEEVLTEYDVDGFELYLSQMPYFFHPKEIDSGRTIMTDWVGKVYELLKKTGKQRELVVRVPLDLKESHAIGLDIEEWIKRGIVDAVVGENVQQGQMTDFTPLIKVADNTKTRVIAPVSNGVGSDRLGTATISVIRATASNYWQQNVDGLYLGGWHGEWPYEAAFYEKLRELPHPEIMSAKDKFYSVPTSEDTSTKLPCKLELNTPVSVDFTISDDLHRWGNVDRVHEVIFRVRIIGHTELDQINFKLNGVELPSSIHRRINELYKQRVPHYRVMGGYWHIFKLDSKHWPKKGINTFTATLLYRDSDLSEKDIICTLRDVEIETKYLLGKSFQRDIVDPDLGPSDNY